MSVKVQHKRYTLRKMKLILSSLFLLGLVGSSIQCSPPGPDWKPLTVEELARRAPLVIKAYLVKSFAQDASSEMHSRRCLFVTQIYRGSLHSHDSNYICADGFGSGAACLSDLSFGRQFIVFLNKVTSGYEARYDQIHSAVQGYSDSVEEELRKGLCCSPGTGNYR